MVAGRFDPWEIHDVSEWPEDATETRGKRSKCWVKDKHGQVWLRKLPLESRPYEPVIESTMLRLARACGIIAPESYVCTWQDHDGRHYGLVVKKFIDSTKEALHSGTIYLRRREPHYDNQNYSMHTFELVTETLSDLEEAIPTANLLLPFINIVCFDAWIGNTDRHQEDWGIISSLESNRLRLAPLYDPAACLGAELQNNHPLLAKTAGYELRLSKYIENCNSGFGNKIQLIQMSELVDRARLLDIWQNHIEDWLTTFSIMLIQTRLYIEKLPVDWLPQPRKELAITLLERRLAWLQERR